jgi:hypothetical protein
MVNLAEMKMPRIRDMPDTAQRPLNTRLSGPRHNDR